MRLSHGLVATLLLLVAAACAPTQPTQFYTLSSVQLPPKDGADNLRTVVAVGPVSLPEYLDRPQIVTRASGNRVMLAEFNSWVEPINGMFIRVLVENLSLLLATDNVIALPQRRPMRLDYQVEVDVTRFDADLNGRALLDARWRVFGREGERLVEEGRSTIVQPADAPGNYEAIVAAMSRALGQMSISIASAIEKHRRR
jgi:uncharacterized lipoprotein YmbA